MRPDCTHPSHLCAFIAAQSELYATRPDGVLSVGLGVRALLLQQGEENIQMVRDLYHLHRILNFDTRDVSLCAYHTDTPFVLESSATLPVVRPAGRS